MRKKVQNVLVYFRDFLIIGMTSFFSCWYYYNIKQGFPVYGDDLANLVRYNNINLRGYNREIVNILWELVSQFVYAVKGFTEDAARLQPSLLYAMIVGLSLVLILILKNKKDTFFEKWSFLPFFIYMMCLLNDGSSEYFGASEAVTVYPFDSHETSIIFSLLIFIIYALIHRVCCRKYKVVLSILLCIVMLYGLKFTDGIFVVIGVIPFAIVVLWNFTVKKGNYKEFLIVLFALLISVLLLRVGAKYIDKLSFLNLDSDSQYGGTIYGISNWGGITSLITRINVYICGILGVFNCLFFDKAILNLNTFSYAVRILIICIYIIIAVKIIKQWWRKQYDENDDVVVALILGTAILSIIFVLADFGGMYINIRYLPAILPFSVIVLSVSWEKMSAKLCTIIKNSNIIVFASFLLLILIYIQPVYANAVDNEYDKLLDSIAELVVEKDLGNGIGPYWAAYNLSVKMNNEYYVDPIDYNGTFLEDSVDSVGVMRQAQDYNFIIVANTAKTFTLSYNYSYALDEDRLIELLGNFTEKYIFGEFTLYYYEDGIEDWDEYIYNTKSDEMYYNEEVRIVNEAYIIGPEGRLSGSIVSLERGTYSIEISGDDLEYITVSVTADNGSSLIEVVSIEAVNDKAVYNITLEEVSTDVDLILENTTDNSIEINQIKIRKDTTNEEIRW
ncbi:MAG: hypothetical protein LIP10_05085 [Clostridiales bacterium]|nr:hypothetical protein [Clostridiales bacterium]